VVCIHAVGTATRQAGSGWHPGAWWGANLLNAACLWCVPVFIMVSGALLLNPAKVMPAAPFLRKRTVRLGVPLIFWTIAYLIFQRQFYGASLGISDTWKAFASGDPYLQLYFLFIVGGLTLLTPVLRRLVAHCSRRELYWLTGGALGFGLLEHAIRDLGGGGGFNAVTIFLPYVGYFLAGYVLATVQLPANAFRIARWTLVAGWLATALGSAALAAGIVWSGNGSFLYDYLSPTVMAMSLAIFVAFRGITIKSPSTTGRLRRLGGATYGVFLIHPLLLFPVMRALGLPDGQDIGRTVAWALPLAIGVCIVTEAACLVLERVPVVRRLIS
jgi:surface polysaccharide O-acyltransferase-like enzyme